MTERPCMIHGCKNIAVKNINGVFDDGADTGNAFIEVCDSHFLEYLAWENGDKAEPYWNRLSFVTSVKDIA